MSTTIRRIAALPPLALLPLLALLTLLGCEDGSPPVADFGPMPVTAAPPLMADITDWDEFTGRFEAVDTVEINARVSGYLQSIHFDEGERVEAGQLLFVIDQRPFTAALDRAQAELRRAEARLTFTETEVKRGESLISRGNLSREQFDQRVQNANQAAAEVDIARANVRSAELDFEFTEIRSPIDGLISNEFVSVGNLISGGSANATVLSRIVSIHPIHFTFDGNEADYLKYLRLDQEGRRPSSRSTDNPVRIKLADEDSYLHQGVMNFVDNRVDPNTGTIRARAVLDNEDGFLTPGVFGRLQLKGKGPYPALLIPDSAILADQSRRFVYVVGDDNLLERRLIDPGPIHRGLRVVDDGLSADDMVVLDGLVLARPGAPVVPQQPPEPLSLDPQ